MSFAQRSIFAALILGLAACGQPQQAQQEAAAPVAEAPPPPVPADFDPCNTATFADVEAVIGTRPTILSQDSTGAASPGWAMCSYGRADGSDGPAFTVRIAKFESGPRAARRHQEIVGGLAGAQSAPNDADEAVVWVDGNNLYLQYRRGWWLTRRTIEGQTDAAARARLIAAPRWP